MALANYADVENRVITNLTTVLSDYVDSNTCKSGDIDSVLEYMFNNSKRYGCWLDLMNGKKVFRPDFTKQIWQWDIACTFIIKVNRETIESDLRNVVSLIPGITNCDWRLNNSVIFADVSYIDRPKTAKINDVPFYWIPFVVTVIDKG